MKRDTPVFFSYSSLQKEFALRLASDLKNYGFSIWMDLLQGDIKVGDNWVATLQNALTTCAGLIAVISPEYVSSKYCRRELDRVDSLGRPIFPILLHSVPAHEWPLEIQATQFVDFRNWRDSAGYTKSFHRLAAELEGQLTGGVDSPPALEDRYLTTLIAELEAHRGVLEYVNLIGKLDTELEFRANPYQKGIWDASFAMLERTPTRTSRTGRYPMKFAVGNIQEALAQKNRLVLIGDPGAGKTTTLRRLALDSARRRLGDPRQEPLPFLVFLPSWKKEHTVIEFLKASWPIDGDFIDMAINGEVFVLLDGLNEMGESGAARARLLRDWLSGDSAPKLLMVTCRSGDYTEELDLGLPTVSIEPLNSDQMRCFVSKYLDSDKANDFLNQLCPANIEENRGLSKIAHNPYLLAALVFIYENAPRGNAGRLPHNTGALFRNLVMALWERERLRKVSGWISFEEMEQVFSSQAFAMLEEYRPIDVSLDYARRFASADLLRVGVSSNIIVRRANKIRFYHQLMQEYFAAVKLCKLGLVTELNPPQFGYSGRIPTRWDQVVIAACGILPDPNSGILEIASIDPWLATACHLSGITISTQTLECLTSRLRSRLKDDDIFCRIASVRCLADLGLRDGIPYLLELLATDDRHVCESAIEVLAHLKEGSASAEILGLLQHEELSVRRAALKALDEIGWRPSAPAEIALYSAAAQDFKRCRQLGAAAVPALTSAAFVIHRLPGRRLQRRLDRRVLEALERIGGIEGLGGLIEIARNSKYSTGKNANRIARSLGGVLEQEPSLLPSLLEVLRDKGVEGREIFIRSLGRIKSPTAMRVLLEGLDDNMRVRIAAAEALGKAGYQEAVPRLVQAMRETLRPAVAGDRGWLIVKEQDEFLSIIGDALEASHWQPIEDEDKVAFHIARHDWAGCSGLGSCAKSGLLQAIERYSSFTWLADEILRALGDAGNSCAFSVVLEVCLDERRSNLHRQATAALRQFGVVGVSALTHALADNHLAVRRLAIKTLLSIGDPSSIPSLVRALRDSDVFVRETAARALRSLDYCDSGSHRAIYAVAGHRWDDCVRIGTTTVPHLIELVADERRFVREEVIATLGVLADERAIPSLIGCLSDKESYCRRIAAQSLGRIGAAEAVPRLIDTLKDKDDGVVAAAATALARMGKTSIPYLLEISSSRDAHLCWVVVEILGAIAEPVAIPDVVRALQSPHPKVRWAALIALGRIRNFRAASPVVNCLRDTDLAVRQAAERVLLKIASPSDVPDLTSRLRLGEWPEICSCLRILEAVGWTPVDEEDGIVHAVYSKNWELCLDFSSRVVPWLAKALEDEDAEMRLGVVVSLVNLKERAAFKVLRKALGDSDARIRRVAMATFSETAGYDSLDDLMDSLLDDDSKVRQWAAAGLERLQWTPQETSSEVAYSIARQAWAACEQLGRAAVPALLQLLRDANPECRLAAVGTLGRIGDQAAIPELFRSLGEDLDIARESLEALVRIGGDRVVSGLIDWLQGPPQKGIEKREVAKALGRLGTPEAKNAVKQWRRSQFAPTNFDVSEITQTVENRRDTGPIQERMSDRAFAGLFTGRGGGRQRSSAGFAGSLPPNGLCGYGKVRGFGAPGGTQGSQ